MRSGLYVRELDIMLRISSLVWLLLLLVVITGCRGCTSQEESEKLTEKEKQKRNEEKSIVVMASRRRAMKELGRVTFSPDTTSCGGSPRVSLRDLPKRERKNYLILIRQQQDEK